MIRDCFSNERTKFVIIKQGIILFPYARPVLNAFGNIKDKGNKIVIGKRTRCDVRMKTRSEKIFRNQKFIQTAADRLIGIKPSKFT